MDPISSETREHLMALYNQSHRHYHNMSHLTHCFKALDRLRSIMTRNELPDSQLELIMLMLWFHDAVYDTGPEILHGMNEQKSAKLFLESREWQRLKSKPSSYWKVNVVEAGILYSAQHTVSLDRHRLTPEQQIFLDIDLCGMGESYSVFSHNGETIRKEYEWVDPEVFMQNRAKFFNTLLKRPYIYYNHVMRGLYEENTRANISRWLTETTR